MPVIPPAGQPDEPDKVNFRIEEFKLDPENRAILGVDIADLIVSEGADDGLLLSIDQGSTVSFQIFDKDLKLLRGDFFTGWTWGKDASNRDEATWILAGRIITASLGSHKFQLVNVQKNGRTLTVLFEHLVSVKMKAKRGPRKAYRGSTGKDVTCAEFIKQGCDRCGVELYCPELHKIQPIGKQSQKVSDSDRKKGAGSGLDSSAKLEMKGAAIDQEQRKNAERSLDVAVSDHAGERPTKAMLVSGIQESDFRRGAVNGAYKGVFQSNQIPPEDVEQQAHCFLTGGKGFRAGGAIKAVKDYPQWTLGQIAAWVEISGTGSPPSNGGDYNKWAGEADTIYAAYHGGSGTQAVAIDKRYAFEIGADETEWDGAVRLAQERGWAFFARGSRAWLISEQDLFDQKPQLATRVTIPGEDGHEDNPVDDIDFEIDQDPRNVVSEITTTYHGDAWTALPGMVQTADGAGTANGKWLVTEINASLTSDAAPRTAKARKPLRELPEPAPDTDSKTVSADIPHDLAAEVARSSETRQKIVAKAISTLTTKTGYRRYSQAGALTDDPTPRAPARSDCSQWARAVYLKAGAGDPGTNTSAQNARGKRVSSPKPGDLLMKPGHCEIYVGGGKTIGHGSPPIDYSTPAAYPGHWFVTFDFLD